jgi:hypothetical protein
MVPVIWHGVDLNPGHVDEQFTATVTLVEGWYGTPPLEGNNRDRVLYDGAVWGNKIIGARTVAIEGAAVGPRDQLIDWRDQLAYLAAERDPFELTIGDPWLDQALTTLARADSDTFRHEFFAGGGAFRWAVTLTCADPLLYEAGGWNVVVLTTATAADAGRVYNRSYPWQYGRADPPGSSDYLTNPGNAAAPVYAIYRGDLSASRLTDDADSILMAPVLAGVEITVATATLVAEAAGGVARAAWILPGSRPMTIPPRSTARWRLYATGSGSVTLMWRAAWV